MAFSSAPCIQSIKMMQIVYLHPLSLQGMHQLTNLHLEYSNISTLPQTLFDGVSNLTHLILNDNQFRNIPNQPFCSIGNLAYLRIDRNNINRFYFGKCFLQHKNLSFIDLSRNMITEGGLLDDDFENLRDSVVTHLKMMHCNISHISFNAFRFLTKLTTLVISENRLLHIPVEAFSRLSNLQSLFLDSTQLTVVNLYDLRFLNISSLNLANNRFLDVSNFTFFSLKLFPLRNLSLFNCHIRYVSSNGLAGFFFLEHLDLLDNHINQTLLDNILISSADSSKTLHTLKISLFIRILNETSFRLSKFQNVKVLHISSGRIEQINDDTFQYFPRLKELVIERSRLQFISKKAFNNLNNLRRLSLERNAITVLPRLVLRNLLELDLTRNKLSTLYGRPFLYLQNLETLLLAANGLRDNDISTSTFHGLDKIKTLDLSKNFLQHLSTSLISPFEKLGSLEKLLLNQNSLNRIHKITFRSLSKLKVLNMESNNLWFQEEDVAEIFKNLTNLEFLSLQRCGIKDIPLTLFHKLTNLRDLYLGKNGISSWKADVFKHLTNLQNLRLNNNRISTINKTSLMWLKSLEILGLSYNPLDCSCNNLWFRNWLETSNINLYFRYVYPFPQIYVYMCASPKEKEGSSFLKFQISTNDCIENVAVIAIEWVAGMFSGCIICACVVIRYRWYIRYWLFIIKSRTKRYAELARAEEYMFDAFVCYHEKDLDWVIQHLLPDVEYRGGFKLCLHHRNWLPGYDITENIVQSIEASRKTILVLTNDFALSKWCQLEASLAQHAYLDDNRDVIILVMLEPIKTANMNARLHSLLTSKTYIEWTQNERGQKLFWKRLRRALMKPEVRGNVEMTTTHTDDDEN